MAKGSLSRVGVLTAMQLAAAAGIVLCPVCARPQSESQATFKPSIEQKVDARSAPAKVTGEVDSALTGKGYVHIGTVSASQPGKKVNPEVTKQLESAILQRAAEAGGDLVFFFKEGNIETTDVPTGKTRKGCTEQETTPNTGWTGGTTTYNTSCYTDIHGFQHCNTSPSTTPGHPTGGGIHCTKWSKSRSPGRKIPWSAKARFGATTPSWPPTSHAQRGQREKPRERQPGKRTQTEKPPEKRKPREKKPPGRRRQLTRSLRSGRRG